MAGGRELKLAISIAGRLDKSLGQATNQAQAQLNSIASSANKYAMRASMAIAIATTKYVKESIETYTEYEDAVNSAAAVFNVSKGTEQYQKLADAARKVPQETIVSAKEGADALKYMALAGWSVEDSINAVIPIVKLAAATEMEIGRASDLVTDSMMAMGMSYDNVGHYVDMLAKGNNSANYTAEQLLESLTSVGGVFRQLNISAEDGSALLGVLASQGTKGAEAGTGMNTVLTRMQKQSGEAAKGMEMLGLSMFNADGSARNILDVFQEMHDKTAKMTTEEMSLALTMIGGQRGIRVLTKLMEGYNQVTEDGVPLVQYLAEAYRNADGALDNFYDIKTDTMEGLLQKIDRLKETMQINTIQAIAPQMTELLNHVMDKMPEIENAIVGVFTNAMPHVQNFLDFIIDHLDDIITGAYNFMRIFWGLKIGTGVLKGLTDITTLFVNLSKLSAARGILPVLKGVFGTFTGISTSGALTTAIGTITSALGPIALVVGGLAGVAIAIDTIDKKFNYTRGLNKYTDSMAKATEGLLKYNELAGELETQKEIILNPKSSTEEVDTAKRKIEEIANMLGVDYSLTIDCDTTELDNTIEKLKYTNRTELIESGEKYIGKAQKGVDKYITDTKNIQIDDDYINKYKGMEETWSQLDVLTELYYTSLENGLANEAEYISQVNDIYHDAVKNGMLSNKYGDDITGMSQVTAFRNDVSGFVDRGRINKKNYESDKETRLARQNVFNENVQKAMDNLISAFASDSKLGDGNGIKTDIAMLTQLGETMVKAGANTDELATKFVTAQQGFTSFSDALGENGQRAQAIAQSYINFKTSIGESSQSAVMGAALIANGFENAAAAANASDETINRIMQDLMSFGEQQGLFDGLDTSGIANKLTEMMRILDLIPDSKAVNINAEGNFEIIEQAGKKLSDLNNDKANPIISAEDNASSTINSVSRKLSNLDGKVAKTKIVTEYETKGKAPNRNAQGAQSYIGGLTYLNDQAGVNDPRELIEYGNMRWWYEGENVLANIPRGARIYTAAQSRAFINGSHENGLDRVPFDGYIAELHKGERILTASEAEGYNRIDFNGMLNVLADMIVQMRSSNNTLDSQSGGGKIVYAPQITIQGNADEATMMRVMRMSQQEFEEMYNEMVHNQSRTKF